MSGQNWNSTLNRYAQYSHFGIVKMAVFVALSASSASYVLISCYIKAHRTRRLELELLMNMQNLQRCCALCRGE